MKRFLFCLLLLPSLLNAQFKRSATELAKENISQFVTNKLFKTGTYHSISYGELTPATDNVREVSWFIEHKFAITEARPGINGRDSVQKLYTFFFYFDKRMNIYQAESYSR